MKLAELRRTSIAGPHSFRRRRIHIRQPTHFLFFIFFILNSFTLFKFATLISPIQILQDDIDKLSSVYESFLAEFPLCHGYWRRYAEHKMCLCSIHKVVEVFERALQAATYCVPLWLDYCIFSMSFFEDPSDIRRLFKRGMSFVQKVYECYTLWDKYIEFEYSQQEWSLLAQIYIQALRFPTKKLHLYYASLKKLATLFEEEMKSQSNPIMDLHSEALYDGEVPRFLGDDEIALVVKDLLDPEIGSGRSKALQRSSGNNCMKKHASLMKRLVLLRLI